jgi:RNA polymerase sigma-70 factor (ECF subfamily)
MEAARRGDTNAFALLFDRHSAMLHKSLLRFLRNSDDAQDAVQEAFLKAFVHLNGFEGKAKFSSWLMRIAINCALMEMRRKRGRFMLPLETNDDNQAGWRPELVETRVDIHGACEAAEMMGRLTKAIGRLKPALRELIELQLSLDCSHTDLAELTKSSIPAVKSRVMRARKALRTAVSESRTAR